MDRTAGPWIVAAAVAGAALFAYALSGGVPDPVGRGSAAPDFTLPQLSRPDPVVLSKLRGRVVLINFWATWCTPCEREMPAMERLHRALADEDFELVAISVDEDRAAVEQFRERLGLTFTIALDPEQRAARSYQTFRFPETLLVDRDGSVVERYVGERDWDAPAYVERIRRLLNGAVPSGPA